MTVERFDSLGAVDPADGRWGALASGATRLRVGAEGEAILATLWTEVVAEARTLHRDLALWESSPSAFTAETRWLRNLLAVLRAQVRPGKDLVRGPWRASLEEGRDDLDRALVQVTLQRAAGESGIASALVVLALGEGIADPRWPLPFEMLTLEDVDTRGKSVVRSIERGDDDGAFAGLLTLQGERPTGNPTDFGVRLVARGRPEWIGGSTARAALEASARAAAAARALAEELSAAERIQMAARSAAVSVATESPAAPARAASPEPTTRSRPRGGPSARPSSETAAESPAKRPRAGRPSDRSEDRATQCGRCGNALAAGVAFCPSCGTPVDRKPAASAEPIERQCASCGAALASDVRFCARCGAAAEAPRPAPAPRPASRPAAPRCASCGTVAQPDARFCRKCGGPLGGAAASPAPAGPPPSGKCGGE